MNRDFVRIYDNGGKTFDRYTAVYMFEDYSRANDGLYECRGMSEHPFHPQGFGQMSGGVPGAHLGKRIKFEDCPPDVQKCIRQDLGGCTPFELEGVAEHYLIAAAWADAQEGTNPRFPLEQVREAYRECSAFIQACNDAGGLFRKAMERAADGYGAHVDCRPYGAPAAFGHDFWLTRQGHGTGFWDRKELDADGLGDRIAALCGWNADSGRTKFAEVSHYQYRGWFYFS